MVTGITGNSYPTTTPLLFNNNNNTGQTMAAYTGGTSTFAPQNGGIYTYPENNITPNFNSTIASNNNGGQIGENITNINSMVRNNGVVNGIGNADNLLQRDGNGNVTASITGKSVMQWLLRNIIDGKEPKSLASGLMKFVRELGVSTNAIAGKFSQRNQDGSIQNTDLQIVDNPQNQLGKMGIGILTDGGANIYSPVLDVIKAVIDGVTSYGIGKEETIIEALKADKDSNLLDLGNGRTVSIDQAKPSIGKLAEEVEKDNGVLGSELQTTLNSQKAVIEQQKQKAEEGKGMVTSLNKLTADITKLAYGGGGENK